MSLCLGYVPYSWSLCMCSLVMHLIMKEIPGIPISTHNLHNTVWEKHVWWCGQLLFYWSHFILYILFIVYADIWMVRFISECLFSVQKILQIINNIIFSSWVFYIFNQKTKQLGGILTLSLLWLSILDLKLALLFLLSW